MPVFQVKYDGFYEADSKEEAARMFIEEYFKLTGQTIYLEVRDYEKDHDYSEVEVVCAATST